MLLPDYSSRRRKSAIGASPGDLAGYQSQATGHLDVASGDAGSTGRFPNSAASTELH